MRSTPLRIEFGVSRWPRRLSLLLTLILLLVVGATPTWPVAVVVCLALCGLWWQQGQGSPVRSLLLQTTVDRIADPGSPTPTVSDDSLRQARFWLGTVVLHSRSRTIVVWPDMLDPDAHAALRAWLQLHPPALNPRMLLS